MDRIMDIINNDEYVKSLREIKLCEKDRKFCKHNKKHFLDVARIAYILKLERNLNIDKEIIYATAMLHDVGKFLQYKNGIPHEIASADIAYRILKQCNYFEEEIEQIVTAIREHRRENVEGSPLGKLIYEADKLSRKCFSCKARKSCNWTEEKKNLKIKY